MKKNVMYAYYVAWNSKSTDGQKQTGHAGDRFDAQLPAFYWTLHK